MSIAVSKGKRADRDLFDVLLNIDADRSVSHSTPEIFIGIQCT